MYIIYRIGSRCVDVCIILFIIYMAYVGLTLWITLSAHLVYTVQYPMYIRISLE